MLKELNFIHFLFPNDGHYVNFDEFTYMLFCKCSVIQDFCLFSLQEIFHYPMKKFRNGKMKKPLTL